MDAIRTLLLSRAHVVVLDADRAASAATRPSRDADVDKLEDELLQLGFVMSLDLAITIRRLPSAAIQELRGWMIDTLAGTLGAHRPHVPLFRAVFAGTPASTQALYLRRVRTWLLSRPEQPCPWCGTVAELGALDPCGHLVCRRCWDAGDYAGCPICHRRVAPGDPFVRPDAPATAERVQHHDGALRVVHLAFDLVGTARGRFQQLLTRRTPLSPADRAEVAAVIDELGARAATWLPPRIAVEETRALVLARLWLASPDRRAILEATRAHLATATDVLRVAVVLMGGDAGLGEPVRLASIGRDLRRVILAALDGLPPASLLEDMRRHAGLWKRVGERLHPYEHAARLPTAALAFAAVRGTRLSAIATGEALRARAAELPGVRIEGDRLRITAWGAATEDGLRAGDARGVADRLRARPDELVRRADHVLRVAQARQPEALGAVLDALRGAIRHAAPAPLLTLGSHVARRGTAWPRRVFRTGAEASRAWSTDDRRAPLRADVIGAVIAAVRAELLARAERRRAFPRAVIDRALGDHDLAERAATAARPTLWDVACIHAAARANLVYVRERDGTFTQVRRRDGEAVVGRLARILAASDDDGTLAQLPPADAPTWFALARDDLAIAAGSEGYALDARTLPPTITRLAAADLIAQLAA